MENNNTYTTKNIVNDTLSEFLKESAQKMLRVAIEEVKQFILSYSETLLDSGNKRVVRNGYLPERFIQTSIGKISVRVPRVRDRKNKIFYTSNLIPKYMRRTVTMDVLLPLLYLKGISTKDLRSPEAEPEFFSRYPAKDNLLHNVYSSTSSAESNKTDSDHYNEIINRMNYGAENLLDTKVMFLNYEQLEKVQDFADKFHENSYILGINDCTDLGKGLFKELDMPTSYNFIFKKQELNTLAGYKLNLRYGNSETPITVYGDSVEQIAKKYNIPKDRIVKRYPVDFSVNAIGLYGSTFNSTKNKEYIILPPSSNK